MGAAELFWRVQGKYNARGYITGYITGNITGYITAYITGNITGYIIGNITGNRAANPCPALGDDQHILVNFLILGDDSKTSCLGVEKPMFFYSFPPKFFDDLFFAKIKIIGGMYPPIPPGFAALTGNITGCIQPFQKNVNPWGKIEML